MTNQTIEKTTDYSLFKTIDGNRHVSNAHVNRLVDAIKSNPGCITYNPILINEKNEVIDGQHRLKAIQKLELPVYFICEPGLTLKNVQALNAKTKPWSPLDYAISFSELGNKNYDIYLQFRSLYNLNHDVLIQYLSLDRPATLESFREGKLKIINRSKSDELCKALIETSEFYDRWKYRSYAFAFKQMWSHPEYDHARFIQKLRAKRENGQIPIVDCGVTRDYIRQFEDIYNHGLAEQKKLRFF